MTHKEYNGWTNYETWVVKLWIDNEEGSYNYWREQAAEAAHHPFTNRLAVQLRTEHEEALPQIQGFAADLLGAAMSEVNWEEIAKSMIDDYRAEHPEEFTEAEAETNQGD